MNIHAFMLLTQKQMERCINQVIPSPNGNVEAEYDIEIFTAEYLRPYYKDSVVCEICREHYNNSSDVPLYDEYIGTSDTREPKYCFQHYVFINFWSEFLEPPEEEDNDVKIADSGECVTEIDLVKESMLSTILESPLYGERGRRWALSQLDKCLRNIDVTLTPAVGVMVLEQEFGLYESIKAQKAHFDKMENERKQREALELLKEAQELLNSRINFSLPDGRTSYEYLGRLSRFLK